MPEVIPIQKATAMHIAPMTGISVVPDWGLGHPEPRGESCGNYSQSDVVDGYVFKLSEELESESVRVSPVQTRKAPALTPAARLDVPAGFVPLVASCDFFTKPRTANASLVEYSGAHLAELARRISEALSEWGRCTAFDHRWSCIPVNDAAPFIRVKPFALNGPRAEDYLLRLEALGVSIGRAVGDYFGEKNILRRRR